MKTLALLTLALTSCASLDGLTKDQAKEQQRQNAAWSDFGRNALTLGLNAGLSFFQASRGDQELPSGKGFRK